LTQLPVGLSAFVNIVQLNLNENEIDVIPAGSLDRLRRLEVLDVTNNRIARLDCGLSPTLHTLHLSFNRGFDVTSIWSKPLPGLRTLKLNHCGITELPGEVPPWATNVRSLHLDGNELTEVPTCLSGFLVLEDLILFANRISSVNHLRLPQQMKQLNFAFNDFKTFTPAESLGAELIDLSSTLLKHVPVPVLAFPHLRVICLSRCKVRGVLDFELPSNVVMLDLSYNRLTGLSDQFVRSLNCLQTLKLMHNSIAGLPDCFPENGILTQFIADDNPIGSLPHSLLISRRIETLSCASCHLQEFPNFHLPGLRNLLVQFNRIAELPDDFGASTFLVTMNVSFNRLGDLPRSLGGCRRMTTLYAAANRFERVPRVILSFTGLTTLVLSGNRLTSLPPDMGGSLYFLQTLDLSNNHLREYPVMLNVFRSLRTLSLSHNAISVVAVDHDFPRHLSVFDLSYNLIEEIAFELPRTASISLDYNLLRKIDPSLFPGSHFVSLNGNPWEDKLIDKLPEFIQSTRVRFLECLGNDSTPLPPLSIHVLDSSCASFPDRFGIGYAATLGRRPTMEDGVLCRNYNDSDFLCGIFDGHCGPVSSLTSARCLEEEVALRVIPVEGSETGKAFAGCFRAVNDQLRRLDVQDGCVTACALIRGCRVHCIGIGDSRIVRVKAAGIQRMTIDHKPNVREEYERLRRHNLVISIEGRIQGKLAIAQCLGDFWCGEGIYVEPDVAEFDIEDDDVALIIACDGLWDMIHDNAAGDIVKGSVTAVDAAVSLKNFAFALGSADNISVLVVMFHARAEDRGFCTRNTVDILPVVEDRYEEEEPEEDIVQFPRRRR
jgi:adenylate cyclase